MKGRSWLFHEEDAGRGEKAIGGYGWRGELDIAQKKNAIECVF